MKRSDDLAWIQTSDVAVSPARPFLFQLAVCACLIFLPLRQGQADWGWYAGDVCVRVARERGHTLRERTQEGARAGFDWMVAFYPIQAGAFRGLSDVAASYESEERRITPILGVGGEEEKGTWGEAIAFGVDPRSPVPTDSLQAIIDWAESHRGVFLFSGTGTRLKALGDRWRGGTAFVGLEGTWWSPDCEVGGGWDRLLKEGRRLFVVGTNASRVLIGGSRTYVWARGSDPSEIVEGFRRGGMYVSEQDGIRMDLHVNDAGMGAVASVGGTASVRVSAAGRHPISRIALVGDGRVVWEASPQSTLVEERLRLPIGDGRCGYLRAIVESRTGGYRAMGNPVFLTSPDASAEASEESVSDRGDSESLLSAMAGAIEIASILAPKTQLAMISTLLKDIRTRAFAAMVLQSRGDMVPDEVLEDLLEAGDRDIRLGAAYASVVRGGENLPELLLGLLMDRDPTVKAYAARMIFQSQIPIPPESLLSFLSDQDPAVRLFLVQAVDGRTDDPNVIHRLIEMVGDLQPVVSDAACDKLVEMGARNPHVMEALANAQRSGNGKVDNLLGRIESRRTGEKGQR